MTFPQAIMSYRESSVTKFTALQEEICDALEEIDGSQRFSSDHWQRPENSLLEGGGGGHTRVLRGGAVFESAGVNFSEVFGTLPLEMSKKLIGSESEQPFFATGVSLVLHPYSPMVPTVHANFRYLEVADKCWFGGGADLTPYYLFEEDAEHFHRTWLEACGEQRYRTFKEECDRYFYLPHREEARGIGGIFFDYLGRDEPEKVAEYAEMTYAVSRHFLPSYLPIVARRKSMSFTEAQKQFQLLRRGRYVEFNLVYDRGTQFGLRTKGRTESILMSLPPMVAWEYCFEPEPGSAEDALLEVLRRPKDWV